MENSDENYEKFLITEEFLRVQGFVASDLGRIRRY
jgi:hypothetical protein